jgi:hypothetical protein
MVPSSACCSASARRLLGAAARPTRQSRHRPLPVLHSSIRPPHRDLPLETSPQIRQPERCPARESMRSNVRGRARLESIRAGDQRGRDHFAAGLEDSVSQGAGRLRVRSSAFWRARPSCGRSMSMSDREDVCKIHQLRVGSDPWRRRSLRAID